MDIITVDDLASYLGLLVGELDASPRAASVVARTNRLVASKWAAPSTPTPPEVEDLALTVAARAWRVDPAKPPIDSITRSAEDASRTERYVSTPRQDGRDVYLTVEERLLLAPRHRRPHTIRIHVPGSQVHR